ncbi:MAG: dihydropteroate synthase [Chloroflexi bacterium]|nr:dihydropteroate synthase [Chloroflexota bacterium]
MVIIGECIHVISGRVRTAIENRDRAFIQDIARRQVKAGAGRLDLNIGPQRKAGPEIMTWMVETVQEATDTPLSLDTTNALAMEAGLKVCKKQPLINSTDATPERMAAMLPLAARYNSCIIALTLAATGLPTTADARMELASTILAAAAEHGVPPENIYLDPLVLTINGNQDQAQQTINAVRFFKQISDPPCCTTCGLSNVSNGAPPEIRPLINRVFFIMMMGAGVDSAIADPFDSELMEAQRTVLKRDASTPKGKLYLALYDAYAAGEEFDPSGWDAKDPELSDILKTIRVLENKTLYAHGYLRL